ncbi:MAG: efflux RND transporter permease subunit [bacterium]|nr:efflux RND transporter permease subunit [bacterium]
MNVASLKRASFVTSRPVGITMVFLAAVVFGYLSLGELAVTLMPELTYPTVTVRTEYPGAAPEEVENDISRPVEEALGVIGGLRRISSISRAGVSDVVLEFSWESEMSDMTQDVLEKLDLVFLPEEAERPLILHYDPSLDPVMELSLSGEGRRFEGESGLRRLRRLAELRIKKELEPVKGVAAVRVRGGLEEEIHVLLEEESLRRSGLAIQQVITRLGQENINVAGGTLQEGRTEYLVRTLNEYENLDQMADTIVAQIDGRDVRIKDIGRVIMAHKEREIATRTDGGVSVQIEIYKEGDANIVDLAKRVRQNVGEFVIAEEKSEEKTGEGEQDGEEDGEDDGEDEQVAAAGPGRGPGQNGGRGLAGQLYREEGAKLQLVADRATFIESSINEVKSTAILGGMLAIVILYLFLRNFKSTAIIAVSIPISLLMTFAPLKMLGVTMNIMSLGGLALGIGMLVDSSIVVLESIYRCREEGDDVVEAANRGTREVRSAVFASTLTSIAVFFPMVFVEGLAGQAFGNLGLAVVVSLLAAAAVALFFIPMLASRRFDFKVGGYYSYFRSQGWIAMRDAYLGAALPVRIVLAPVFAVRFALGFWFYYVGHAWSDYRKNLAEAPTWFKVFNVHNFLIQLILLVPIPFVVRWFVRTDRFFLTSIRRIWTELRDDAKSRPVWQLILAAPYWLVRAVLAIPLPYPLLMWPWTLLLVSKSWGAIHGTFSSRRVWVKLLMAVTVLPVLYLAIRWLIGSLFEGIGHLAMWILRVVLAGFFRVTVPIVAAVFRGLTWLPVRATNIVLDGLNRGYPPVIRSALAHPVVIVLIVVACFWGTWEVVKTLDSELLPEVHQGEFTVEVQLPVGTPIEETERVVAPIEQAILAQKDDIRSIVLTTGYDSANSQRSDEGEHTARFKVLLEDSRDPVATELTVMDRLRDRFEGVPDLEARIVRPVLFSSKTPIEVEIHGDDLQKLKQYADDAGTLMADMPELADIEISLERGAPEVQIVYDRDRLTRYELNVQSVAQLVRNKVKGFEATRFNLKDRRIPILVQLELDDRETIDDIRGIIVNPGGERPIRLSSVAAVALGEGPSEVRRIDGRRVAVVSANLGRGSLSAATARIQDELNRRMTWPSDMTFLIAGQNEEWERSRRSLWIAMALSVFLVYVIMAAQFESLLHPLVIMLTIPLAMVGTVLTLRMLGMNLSIVVFLGMIMLAGIVVNNAIVMVDYINTLRRRGMPRDEAIVTAGSVRLRPILMTTATTVLGLTPMALGLGDGAEIRTPMAIAVISGLISSTALTLIIVPSVYSLTERAKARMLGRTEPGETHDEAPAAALPGAGSEVTP